MLQISQFFTEFHSLSYKLPVYKQPGLKSDFSKPSNLLGLRNFNVGFYLKYSFVVFSCILTFEINQLINYSEPSNCPQCSAINS